MAIDINYSPEQHDSISGDITVWWCLRCNEYHVLHCPLDLINGEEYDGYQNKNYEICPCCGQLIKGGLNALV